MAMLSPRLIWHQCEGCGCLLDSEDDLIKHQFMCTRVEQRRAAIVSSLWAPEGEEDVKHA